MRTFIFLIDAPMNFKVKTFDAENIGKIKNDWGGIRQALIRTTLLLRKFGFSSARLSSNYAATIVAYYLYKDGVVDSKTEVALERFVRVSLLKQIYSGQADTTLSMLREGIRQKLSESPSKYALISNRFDFDSYKSVKLPLGKNLRVDQADIEYFLSQKKGPFTFLLLSFLYPQVDLDTNQFHQDHMHPYSKFTSKVLREAGVNENKLEAWKESRDQLPNLQFLSGTENVTKQAEFLENWVTEKVKDREHFLNANFVLLEQSLAFKNFESFFEARKENLRAKLSEVFDVTFSNSTESH